MACAGSDGDEGEASLAASSSTPGQPSASAPAVSESASSTNAAGTSNPPTTSTAVESSATQSPTAPATTQVDPPAQVSTGAPTDEPAASTSSAAPEASATLTGAPAGEGGANNPPVGGEGGEGEEPEDSSGESSAAEQDAGAAPDTDVTEPNPDLEPFSFFVTSLEAMRTLSQNDDGFGGDLRYGEADGLSGADKICAEIAELSMEGAASKQWRAFLSVAAGPDGGQVDAIDRIGEGPWYDRLGRLVSEDITGLLNERPAGDAEVVDDLPNELGEPNSFAGGVEMDNHDTLTGSDETGHLDGGTCADWTSTTSTEAPLAGHSWPAGSGQHWIRSHGVHGCAPSVVDGQGSFGMGEEGGGVGDGGGYGGIYCFALNP